MKTLLLVGLGPVQEFIERARRTRDLWFGSHILSEMSRGVARSLSRDGWTLVFPALDADSPELTCCDGMWRQRDDTPNGAYAPVAVSNKVLAVREGTFSDDDIEVVAAHARTEALAVWRHFAEEAVKRAGSLLRGRLRTEHTPVGVIDDLLEFVVAWRHFGEGEYGAAFDLAEHALDARKGLRDFSPWQGEALPKSSLDGHRETIFAKDAPRSGEVVRRFRIGPGEQLDGVGVVKRMGGKPDHFIPVARVALAPWIVAIEQRVASGALRDAKLEESWVALLKACDAFGVTARNPNAPPWLGGSFPYDAELFLEGQWASLDFFEGREGAEFGKTYVRPVLDALGQGTEPYSYIACLRGDGDHMGKVLRALPNDIRHRAFSEALGAFAKQVRADVTKDLGVTIYAGGDDLLALVPVERAASCAAALQGAFVAHLGKAFEGTGFTPTLSIGVAVCHVLTALGEVLGRAKEALRFAKEGDELPVDESRCALAVIVDKRAGGPRRWRCRWDEDPGGRMAKLADGFASERIPGGLPFEVERLLRKLPHPAREGLANDIGWAQVARSDVLAILQKKQPDALNKRGIAPEEVDLHLDPSAFYEEIYEALNAWVDRCCIARELAAARRSAARIGTRGEG